MQVRHRRVLVIGLGKSGVAAAKALASGGAEVTVTDTKSRAELEETLKELEGWPVHVVAGAHPAVKRERFDLVVTSPGVPVWARPLQEAVAEGIPVWSEIELGYRLAKGPVIAITGTNGKTTTTALTGQMFKDAGYRVSVAGNIGVPLVQEAVVQPPGQVFVVEVSSFQLEWVEEFRPKVALVTNITPDHLERHGTMEEYTRVKARIFQNQGDGDYTVLNYDDPVVRRFAGLTGGQVIFFSRLHKLEEGVFVKDGNICIRHGDKEEAVCAAAELTLPGAHNLENALAAVAAGWALGLSGRQMAETLGHFPGVPHRLEKVAVINGVEYINDSKGTNPEAAIKALLAFDKPIVLIAGGSRKGNMDFSELAHKIKEKVRELILVGETAEEIKAAVEKVGFHRATIVNNLEEGVKLAAALARPGEIVLLSPACASFDFFRNFEHRGEVFKELVHRLA